MGEAKLSAEDKKWRAENDVRTLIEAEEIKADPERYKAAIKAGRAQASAIRKVTSAKA